MPRARVKGWRAVSAPVLVLLLVAGALAAVAPSTTLAADQTITASGGTCAGGNPTPAWTNANPTINVGDTVTWNNCPAGNHALQSTSSGWCLASGSTSGTVGAPWTFACQFTAPGSYTYQCAVHGAAMAGTVTVAAASGSPSPSASPSVSPSAAAASPSPSPSASRAAAAAAPLLPGSGAVPAGGDGFSLPAVRLLVLLLLAAAGGAFEVARRRR